MPDRLTRRRFILELAVFSGGALFAGRAGAAAMLASGNGEWVQVGPLSKFKVGGFTHVVLPQAYGLEQIYVAQRSDRTLLALWARCTHRGCFVVWKAGPKQFDCPCHGGRFDSFGINIAGPPTRPLRSLETRIDEHGMVSVEIPGS